jgi:hypothetical protein
MKLNGLVLSKFNHPPSVKLHSKTVISILRGIALPVAAFSVAESRILNQRNSLYSDTNQ